VRAPSLKHFALEKVRERAPGSLVHLPQGAVYVEESGPKKGEPVVLVHGIAASTEVWKLLSPFLVEAGYRVICFDLYGRGLSDRGRGRHSPALFRAQLRGLLEALGVREPIHLVGLSMGGLVAADYAAHHPGAIRRVALIAPAGVPTYRPWWAQLVTRRGIGELLFVGAGRRIMPRLMGQSFASDAARREWVPRLLSTAAFSGYRRSLLSSMRHMPLDSAMGIFEAVGLQDYPVGVFWGARDRVCPFANRNAVLQAIPRAQVSTFASGGHAVHLDCPTAFHAALIRFLSS
jgi:pimeloyl-ACP methyl ester carboxylesterase